MISELSDQANTSLLDCAAWAEGDVTSYSTAISEQPGQPTPRLEQDEADAEALEALSKADETALQGLIAHLQTSTGAMERLTKIFLTGLSSAPEEGLKLVLETKFVNLHAQDEINDRNSLHKAAMTGRRYFLIQALAAGVDPKRVDAYGRIPLHYACMNGHVELVQDLVQARPETIDVQDLDNFSGLIHAIVQGRLTCVEKLLSFCAQVDPARPSDHIPLNLACQHGSSPIVELLLKGMPRLIADAEGLYPQHLVARFGQDPQIFLLLQAHGADLDQQDKLYQWTPLFHAASEGRVHCLERLLELGVKPQVIDEKGLSAQYYATWEGHLQCMETLESAVRGEGKEPMDSRPSSGIDTQMSPPASANMEMIPDLSLPPPIIPTRRYGHNFLQNKTTVVITFDDTTRKAVAFDDESKYPAARLTIAPRSSDIMARNILLPMQDDNRSVSFEMDSLDTFTVDFDVYPTYGKKVVAKASVPSEVFKDPSSSSGYHFVSLVDPRLRSVGLLYFKYQVIQPFRGAPLDITSFATYWKATSQVESRPSSLITGSSLSGEYVRLYVQLSRDGIPVLYPKWTIDVAGVDVPVIGLSYLQLRSIGGSFESRQQMVTGALDQNRKSGWSNLSLLHRAFALVQVSLDEALSQIPSEVHIELHVLYPSEEEESRLRLGPSKNINDFADCLLKVIFQHARHSRGDSGNTMRSIVLTSYNKDVCTALNWKQPNCESSLPFTFVFSPLTNYCRPCDAMQRSWWGWTASSATLRHRWGA